MHCQKCRTPLRLDGSLEDLNPAAYDLLVATHSQQAASQQPLPPQHKSPEKTPSRSLLNHVSQTAGPATFKRPAPSSRGPAGLRDSSAMSFIFLTESQVALPARRTSLGPPRHRRDVSSPQGRQADSDDDEQADGTKTHEMERINKLFEILSARSDVDHPVCVECTELLVEEMQKKLEVAARERDAYVGFLKKAQQADGAASDDEASEELRAQKEALARAQRDEAAAVAELRRLEADKAGLDGEVLALEEESRQLDAEEEKFWRERNEFAARLAGFQNERDSVNSRFDHDSRLLEKLQRSNVYNDTFCISHDGTFATINGLRLGRLHNRPVDWPEINAAWGHALLLLVTVADKLHYRFQGYEPQPMGSTSRIVRYDALSPSASASLRGGPPPAPKKHVLDLFSSGDMPLGLTFMHRKFDNAMTAFLELVRQLGAHVQQQTAAGEGGALSLPYRIDGDKIGDVSIKLGIAQDDGWTKACKLTLTCCKFLLAHASNVNSAVYGRNA